MTPLIVGKRGSSLPRSSDSRERLGTSFFSITSCTIKGKEVTSFVANGHVTQLVGLSNVEWWWLGALLWGRVGGLALWSSCVLRLFISSLIPSLATVLPFGNHIPWALHANHLFPGFVPIKSPSTDRPRRLLRYCLRDRSAGSYKGVCYLLYIDYYHQGHGWFHAMQRKQNQSKLENSFVGEEYSVWIRRFCVC